MSDVARGREVMEDVARPSTRRRQLGIILTILGLIWTVGLSILWVIHSTLLIHILAIISALILATGLTLFRPLRFIEGEP